MGRIKQSALPRHRQIIRQNVSQSAQANNHATKTSLFEVPSIFFPCGKALCMLSIVCTENFSTLIPLRVRRGYMASSSLCVMT